MEPVTDRIRRQMGLVLLVLVFGGILGGVAFLGRIVGDAIGTVYVGTEPGADDLPPLPTQPGLAVDRQKAAGNTASPDRPEDPPRAAKRQAPTRQ
ncbi:MAG TPA: hypothetical protein VGZ22_30235 [Isosphaeraceae bacterium]|jgi:hypothetical protein|nr:hypothetical protein [Isosphaeraceae bacterium]